MISTWELQAMAAEANGEIDKIMKDIEVKLIEAAKKGLYYIDYYIPEYLFTTMASRLSDFKITEQEGNYNVHINFDPLPF